MVYYLKVNRMERYSFKNLQYWIDILACIEENPIIYIICDSKDFEAEMYRQIDFKGLSYSVIESIKKGEQIELIANNIANERWMNAAYAHLTTFFHAKDNDFEKFWNIDADDTCFCLTAERTAQLINAAREKADELQYDIFSLDMWYTRRIGQHWTFGVSYTRSTEQWIDHMVKHCMDDAYKNQTIWPWNLDGYFSYLKELDELKIETWYCENLKFIHYSDDFFKRLRSSGFYHWKDGRLVFPLIQACIGIDSLGSVPIPEDVVGLDIGIEDIESQRFLIDHTVDKEYLMKDLVRYGDEDMKRKLE